MLHVLAVVVAALCFATTGTSQALADVDGSPLMVGAARGVLGGLFLALVAFIKQRRSAHRQPDHGQTERQTRMVTRTSRIAIALGVIGVLAYNGLFFAGTAINGVAVGTVVAVGSAPIAAGIFEAFVLHRPPRLRWVVATVVALAGVVLVSGLLAGSTDNVSIPGLLASMGAGASYALYTVASKTLFNQGWSTSSAMGVMFGIAGALSVPILLVGDISWLFTGRGVVLTLWLGVMTVGLAYTLWAWGLQKLQGTTVTTLTLAEPMGATLLGLLVLRETLTTPAALGVALIGLGLVIIALPKRTARR